MVLTRRMAKLQATSHGDSNAAAITEGGPTQVRPSICEDAAREAADLATPTHGNGNEGSGALITYSNTEDESTLTGPRSVVSYIAEDTVGTSTYRGRQEVHDETQPRGGPSATTQVDGHFPEIPQVQTVSAQNEYHGNRHSPPLSSAHPSPLAVGRDETNKKTRKRKGARTRWSRTKGQKAKATDKVKVPIQNAKVTHSINTVEVTDEQSVPIRNRPMKCLPQRAVKTAEIIEAVRKAEATARKGKWKANSDELPTTWAAPMGSKRARNECPFDVEDIVYPHLGWTTRRVRRRTVGPPEPASSVEAQSTRQLRRRRVSRPAQSVRNKRKASALEPEDMTTKRRKMEPDSPSSPVASYVMIVKSERTSSTKPSALPMGQIQREQSMPACLQSREPSTRRQLHNADSNLAPDAPRPSRVPSCISHRGELLYGIFERVTVGPHSLISASSIPKSSVVPVPLPTSHQPPSSFRPALRAGRTKFRTWTSGSTPGQFAASGTVKTIANDADSNSGPDVSQPVHVPSSIRHRKELLIGVFERVPLCPISANPILFPVETSTSSQALLPSDQRRQGST